jgi:hypothetical protein
MSKNKTPTLFRLTDREVENIGAIFAMYDIMNTGKIPRHLARNLVKALGFGRHCSGINASEVGLPEILLFLDLRCPEPDQPLNVSLHTFVNTIGMMSSLPMQLLFSFADS